MLVLFGLFFFFFVFLLLRIKQGADKMLDYYNGNLQKALIHLFPEIRLDEASFANLRRMCLIVFSFQFPLFLINRR
jgi:hypothetical protein